MKNPRNDHQVVLLALAVLFVIGLVFNYLLIFGSQLNLLLNQGDSLNMLERGWTWVEAGKLTPFGQGMSGGGKLPGSLTTLLVGIPLWLWPSYESPVLVIVVFHAISYLVIDRVFARQFGALERILFAIFYWLSPWRVIYSSFLWNPNYLVLFGAVHFYTAFRLRTRSNLTLGIVHLLSIGFALQLHGSFLILALATGFLQLRNKIQLSRMAYAISAIIILATMSPTLLALFEGTDTQVAGSFYGRGLVYGYPIKAVLYWIRYSSFYLPNEIMLLDVASAGHSEMASIVLGSWEVVAYPMAGLSVLVSLMANYDAYKKIKGTYFKWKPETSEPREWIYHYLATIFLSVLASTALSPAHLQFWHLFIILPFAFLPLIFYLAEVIRTTNQWNWGRQITGGCLLYAIFFLGGISLFFSAENTLSYTYDADRQRQKFRNMKDVRELFPEQSIKRIEESLQQPSNDE